MTTLAQLERQKSSLLELIRNWSSTRISFRPNPTEWSALEVFDHLSKTEAQILARAQNGLCTHHSVGLRDRIGFLILDRIFVSAMKVKVPKSASNVLPAGNLELDTILNFWNQTRINLAQTVNQLTPDQMRAGVFRHPISGWMSFAQVLRFFSIHIIHHEHQLRRLANESRAA